MSVPTPSSAGFDEELFVTVREMMTPTVITVTPETNLLDAVKMMNERRIGSLVVVAEKKPIGMITERDIMTKVVGRVVSALDLSVANVMSSPARTVFEDDSLESATRLMVRYQIRRLAVVNRAGGLVGILTSTDVVREVPETMNQLSKRIGLTKS